ncbi:MAG: copper homeostasis protein CutC [Mycoplasmatales bacterium]
MNLEVIALNLDDAKEIEGFGANRIELVTNIAKGGFSPEIVQVKQIVDNLNIPVNVMVRFKEDFVYNQEEFNKCLDYIKELKETNANALVFGSLNEDGSINEEQLEEVCRIKGKLKLTFHRAIDSSKDLLESIKTLNKYDVDVILTSGGLDKPILENIDLLKEMSLKSKAKILLGGGINIDNYSKLIDSIDNVDIHVGSLAYNESNFNKGINKDNICSLLDYIKE